MPPRAYYDPVPVDVLLEHFQDATAHEWLAEVKSIQWNIDPLGEVRLTITWRRGFGPQWNSESCPECNKPASLGFDEPDHRVIGCVRLSTVAALPNQVLWRCHEHGWFTTEEVLRIEVLAVSYILSQVISTLSFPALSDSYLLKKLLVQ